MKPWMRQSPYHLLACAAAVTAALSLPGCGSDAEGGMAVFEQIGRLPTREELVEVELGHFLVPVPIVLESANDRFATENLMQIEIDLVAIVSPAELSMVERLKDRREGRLRDRIITVCRNTIRDDLVEPEKVTLKAHLLDAVQPLLGDAVRKLVIRQVNLEEL